LPKKQVFYLPNWKGRRNPVAVDVKTRPLPPIVVEPHEWEELSGLLQRYAPGRRVWAFGSRATGHRVRRFSDLDIAVEGEELPFDEMAMLREALDESRLPFKVDVLELGRVAPEFRARIQPELVLVQGRESSGIKSS
jgi:predicted nucleotidyltransferase